MKHKCEMKTEILEMRSDIKSLLSFKWKVVGIALACGTVVAIAGAAANILMAVK